MTAADKVDLTAAAVEAIRAAGVRERVVGFTWQGALWEARRDKGRIIMENAQRQHKLIHHRWPTY